MVSTNVMAEWTEVGSNDEMTVYIDFGTIKRKGSKVKMWSLYDLKTLKTSTLNNTRYLSQLIRKEFDCEEETKRLLDSYLYSGNMRSGDIVFSSTNIKLEAESIIPESMDALSLKIACYKK
jgi:hypothetical protein